MDFFLDAHQQWQDIKSDFLPTTGSPKSEVFWTLNFFSAAEKKIQSLEFPDPRFRPEDSQFLGQSLISCLAIIVRIHKNPSGCRKNFGPKTSDLGHIQFLCGTSPCLGLGLRFVIAIALAALVITLFAACHPHGCCFCPYALAIALYIACHLVAIAIAHVVAVAIAIIAVACPSPLLPLPLL